MGADGYAHEPNTEFTSFTTLLLNLHASRENLLILRLECAFSSSVKTGHLPSSTKMYHVTLLALLSTHPVAIGTPGSHGPEGGLFSQKSNLENEQPPHAIATLVRRLRRENQCFSALSTLAVALVVGFLIVRCFIAMAPRLKHERPIVSRRLASGADQICSVSIQRTVTSTWNVPCALLFCCWRLRARGLCPTCYSSAEDSHVDKLVSLSCCCI